MKKYIFALLLCAGFALPVLGQSNPPLTVTEPDGSPRVTGVTTLRFSNGSVSCSGKVCTVTTGGGGGGTPGGANTQVQYNNAGSFGGVAGFTFNGTSTISLGVAGTSVGAIGFRNATSGTITLQPVTGALGTVTLSLPAVTDTLVGLAATQTLSNKTLASPSLTGNITGQVTSQMRYGSNVIAYEDGVGPKFTDSNTGAVLTFNTQSVVTDRIVTWPNIALTVAGVDVANSWADGVKQTFNPDATTAGINVGSVAGDPSAPANGDLWYDSTANELTARINGANVALGAGGGGITVGTTTVTSGTATRLFYETAGNVVGQVSGVTSDGTNVTAGSGNLRATSPRITTGINDANGNEAILLTATASAVNEWTATNAATGGTVTLAATGDDANIPINIWAKGTAAAAIAKFGTTGGWQLQVSNSIGFRVATVDAGTTSYFNVTAGWARVTSGMGIGWNSSATQADSGPDAFFMRGGTAHIRMGNTDAASPVAQTLSVQNVVGGTSNTAGATWTQRASLQTGNAVPGRWHMTGGALSETSGTTQATAVDRLITGAAKVLTNNSATTILNVTNASNTNAGGVLDYCVEVFDATDVQYECGMVTYGISNKGGVFSGNTVTKFGNHQNATSGTLTVTFAISAANPGALSVNANSSLTPSTGYPRITYSLRNLGQQSVAVQ